MKLITTQGSERVWLGRLLRPFEYVCPAAGEYALLLVVADDEIAPEEQADLSERIVRSGCRYAVCFGPTSSSWDDAIDMVSVMDEVEGRESRFVMTTWHDKGPLEETIEFFANSTHFEEWSTDERVVLVLGGTAQIEDDVQGALLRAFGGG